MRAAGEIHTNQKEDHQKFRPIIPGAAMIPVFSGPGADTHPVLCQVAAIALHHGATPASGHYRCVFFPSECAVNAEPGSENPGSY